MRNDIKKIRKEMGIRQEDLAKLTGSTRQTIIAVENNKYNPSLELALRLAQVLKTPVERLFFLE